MVWLGGAPASRPQIKEEHDGAPGVAQETIICPKCKQQMLEGFIPDRFDHLTAVAGVWIEGRPQVGWTGGYGGVKWRDKKRLPIATYRCQACGYLRVLRQVSQRLPSRRSIMACAEPSK